MSQYSLVRIIMFSPLLLQLRFLRFVFIGKKQFPFDSDTHVGLRVIAVLLFEVDSGLEPLGLVEESILSSLCRRKVSSVSF